MGEQGRRASFAGRLVMLGFGSIGQGMLPLLRSELGIAPERIRIVKAKPDETGIAAHHGVEVIPKALDQESWGCCTTDCSTRGSLLAGSRSG